MATQKVSNKQIRDIQRATHLVVALILVLSVYTPLGSASLFITFMQFLVLPVLAATGILMWQWTRLRRLFSTHWGGRLMLWRNRVAGSKEQA